MSSKNEIQCIVTAEKTLVPKHDSDRDRLNHFNAGDTVTVLARKPRNPKFHRKFMALVRLTHHNLPERLAPHFPSVDSVLEELKFLTGQYEVFCHVTGDPFYRTKSISFAKMDEVEFREFYELCTVEIITHFLKHLTADEIEREIGNFL